MNGRIDQPGDWDVFRFQGRAGEAIVAEVYARRLDSPLDSVLKLTDAKGTQLAFNDDYDDPGAGLETHHADSRILTTLPANGTYYLYLGDAQQKGGPEYAYRLRIGAATARFRSAGHPVEHQRQRRHDRCHHRPCPAQRWILRGHRAGVKGRSQRIHPDRRPAAGRPGRGAAHAHRSAATPAGTAEPEPGRPGDHPGTPGQPAGGSGGGHDAGFRLPPSGPRQRLEGRRPKRGHAQAPHQSQLPGTPGDSRWRHSPVPGSAFHRFQAVS